MSNDDGKSRWFRPVIIVVVILAVVGVIVWLVKKLGLIERLSQGSDRTPDTRK